MKKILSFVFVMVAALMALPLAVSFTEDGTPVYTPWTQEMKDALYANFKIIDSQQQGVDRSKLRLFYPMLGWNDIQMGLDALVADGRLQATQALVGTRPVEVFIWKGA